MVASLFVSDASQGSHDASMASQDVLAPVRRDATMCQSDARMTLDVTHGHETFLQLTSESDACDASRTSFKFFEHNNYILFANYKKRRHRASLCHRVTPFFGGGAR